MQEKRTMSIPLPEGVKGLIFDLDGTIIDSMPLHHRAYNASLEPYGVHYPLDVFHSRGGIPTSDTLRMIETEHQITNFDLPLALETKRKFVDAHLSELTLIQPVWEVIKAFHSKLPMAIGTGSNRQTVNEMFALFPFGEYFTHVVTATDVENFKPHPETFLKGAELIGIDPSDCVVFEDGKPGMVAAESAGMQVIDITKFV